MGLANNQDKGMPNKSYWFHANKTGPGWQPVTWQGRVIMTSFCTAAIAVPILPLNANFEAAVALFALSALILAVRFRGEPHEWFKEQWRLKREYRKNAKHWWQRIP